MKRPQFAITSSTMTYRKLGPSRNLRLVRQGWTTPSSWRGLAGIGCFTLALNKPTSQAPEGFIAYVSHPDVPSFARGRTTDRGGLGHRRRKPGLVALTQMQETSPDRRFFQGSTLFKDSRE